MPNYPLRFTKGATVPPSVRLSVTLEKTSDRDKKAKGTGGVSAPECEECEECPECPDPEPCGEVFLPRGEDMIADAPEIPLSEFHDLLSLPTYNRCLTTEPDEPEHGYGDLWRTAWWKIFVPDGQTWHLSVDTRFSFWERGAIPDTVVAVYGLFEPWGNADFGPSVQDSDSAADSAPGMVYYGFGRLTDCELHGNVSGDSERDPPDGKGPGTWFYIQVAGFYNPDDDLGDEPAGVAYVLRVSLTQFEFGSIPQDAEDPDMYPEGPCTDEPVAFADQLSPFVSAPSYLGDLEGSDVFIADRLFARGASPDLSYLAKLFTNEPPDANYSITANVNFACTRGGGTANQLQLGLRWDDDGSNSTGYLFYFRGTPFDPGVIDCMVVKIVGGTETTIRSIDPLLCDNSTAIDVKVSAIGSELKIFFDGVEVWSGSDSSITEPGNPFIGMYPDNVASSLYFSLTFEAFAETA